MDSSRDLAISFPGTSPYFGDIRIAANIGQEGALAAVVPLAATIMKVIYSGYEVNSSESVLFRNVRYILTEVEQIKLKLLEIEKKIDELTVPSESTRDIAEQQAIQEIKEVFNTHHGETIYPSEIADELRLDYDLVVRLLMDLENAGSIKSADAASAS